MENETPAKSPQSKAAELEECLINFAVRIIKLSASLPKTPAGKHIAGQILRSGTSPAPNYGEARGAESHADFVHKYGIVLKELNETSIWLRVIERSEIRHHWPNFYVFAQNRAQWRKMIRPYFIFHMPYEI